MITFENTEVVGWKHAIRGMRNPKNSWEKSDSNYCIDISCSSCPAYDDFCKADTYAGCDYYAHYRASDIFVVGPNDHKLMMGLACGGSVHAKYRRMIVVYVDITAPLYWWKEFDTYKVGTVANSCSTMHKITAKEFTLEDFSYEHLRIDEYEHMKETIKLLNINRLLYLDSHDKDDWWQLIQLLPSSYNQRRTVMLNYEVLAGIYPMRKDHKLDEWHDFCHWIEALPYSEIIIGGERG